MVDYLGLGAGVWGFGAIMLILVLFFGAIAWLIMWLVNKNKAPLETLKERYARGEISKKGFIEAKNELSRK